MVGHPVVFLSLLRQVSSISPASAKETCFAAEGAYDWCNMRQDRQLLARDFNLEQRNSYSSNKKCFGVWPANLSPETALAWRSRHRLVPRSFTE